jgi:hypothetical protein
MHLILLKTFLKYIKFLTVKKKTEKKKIRKIPGMGKENTTRQEGASKKAKKKTHKKTKRDSNGGVERSCGNQVFIDSVGSSSGLCINAIRTRTALEMSRLVVRVRMIYPYRPAVGCCVRPDVT